MTAGATAITLFNSVMSSQRMGWKLQDGDQDNNEQLVAPSSGIVRVAVVTKLVRSLCKSVVHF